MSFWHDHFGLARFGIAHFVAGPFWSRHFWREFHENNFFFCFFFQFFNFLIYIFSIFLFSFFFSKTVKDFLFIFNKFLSTLHKNTFKQIRIIREFSMNLYLLWKSLCKLTPESYFQWSGSRTVKSDGAKLYNLVLNSAIKLF